MRVLLVYRPHSSKAANTIAELLISQNMQPAVRVDKEPSETLVHAFKREISQSDRVVFLWENDIKATGSISLLCKLAGEKGKAFIAYLEQPKKRPPIETLSISVEEILDRYGSSQMRSSCTDAFIEALQTKPPVTELVELDKKQRVMLYGISEDENVLHQIAIRQMSEAGDSNSTTGSGVSAPTINSSGSNKVSDDVLVRSNNQYKQSVISCTAFCPKHTSENSAFLIQVCFHNNEEPDNLLEKALSADSSVSPVGQQLRMTVACLPQSGP